MASQKRVLTPEQLALSEERKRKKAEAAAAAANRDEQPHRRLALARPWLSSPTLTLSDPTIQLADTATIMSWNMLAQCLVRRELFPGSDCLRVSQREPILFEEITTSSADIICLQEVDRIDRLSPVLEAAGYTHLYSRGPRKQHGCLIAFRSDLYTKIAETTVLYDDISVRPGDQNKPPRKGSSFRTRNIGFVVALKRLDNKSESQYIIVATTHLFWHPRYTYERARQALILVRAICDFKDKNSLKFAPTILAGDFNFSPSDPAYSLLVGDPLTLQQERLLEQSFVVHVSVDPSVPVLDSIQVAQDDEEGGEALESGSMDDSTPSAIKNARQATATDGLLSARGLEKGFAELPSLRSTYDEWCFANSERTFGSREVVAAGRRGGNEPIYTSYTHYWKTTLDYIFVLLPPEQTFKVLGVMAPLTKQELGDGLPCKGICGSDHISVQAKIFWPKTMLKRCNKRSD